MDTSALPLSIALNITGDEASVRFKTGRQRKVALVQIQFNFPRNRVLGDHEARLCRVSSLVSSNLTLGGQAALVGCPKSV
jgi:hypothetical protein